MVPGLLSATPHGVDHVVTTYLLFGLFAATLLGIAKYHKHALPIAISGLVAVILVKCVAPTADGMPAFTLLGHLQHESQTIANLGGLLLGFAVLANYFEKSHLSDRLTAVLPAGRCGAFLLLALVAVLSSVLDNIAAALIGGAAAITLFRFRVHIGYLAAIVAASNAGGAASVVGDTTTTMIWLAGASPLEVGEAVVGAAAALLFVGFFASRQQHALQPMVRPSGATMPLDGARVVIVGAIIGAAIWTNIAFGFPAAGVWGAIALGALWRRPDWAVLPAAATGACFLLSLVLSASLMPVESLPPASAWSALGLGFVSAFFDNIPLTALAIKQGGYDWGYLAFCVGYGGSMLWFGSSAGVAISGLFPEAKSAKNWLISGWHVAVGYVVGVFAMLLVLSWQPRDLPKKGDHALGSHDTSFLSQPPR